MTGTHPDPAAPHLKPKRRHFWIDAPAQLSIMAFVLGLLTAGLILSFLSMDRGLAQAAQETQRLYIPVDWARQALRGPFVLSSAIILLGSSILTLLWSHRVVGPLLVLTAGLRRMRDGNLKTEMKVRDTDSLKETVEDLAEMQASLRRHVEEDRERVAALDQRLGQLAHRLAHDGGSKHELSSIQEELRKVTSFFQL